MMEEDSLPRPGRTTSVPALPWIRLLEWLVGRLRHPNTPLPGLSIHSWFKHFLLHPALQNSGLHNEPEGSDSLAPPSLL
jgi:hypothetical protein